MYLTTKGTLELDFTWLGLAVFGHGSWEFTSRMFE